MVKPTLHGEMLVLRPFGPQDAEPMWELLCDPEARRLAGMSREYTRADVERRAAGELADEHTIELAVTTTTSDEYLGEIVLGSIDPYLGTALLRLAMRPAYRGRGYGTEALQLVLGMAFGGLGLHRVGLVVPAVNTRATSLYENIGFRIEGRLREAFRDGEGRTDGIVMGVLEDEYRAAQHL